jgi:cytochrome c5
MSRSARSLLGRNIRSEKVPQPGQFFDLLRRLVVLCNEKDRENGPLWCIRSRIISTVQTPGPAIIAAAFFLAACAVDTTVDNNAAVDNTVMELNDALTIPVGHYGYGKDASTAEIAGWDIDVRPDGMGLPPGSATAEDGEMLYEDQCAVCHGSFGEGVGRYPVLAGGEGTLSEPRPERTIGSFWPYASTVWDYIHRAMPYTEPESLTDEEVYAITAYVLYLNDLVEYDFELTQENLASIEMPNQDGFYLDDRPDVVSERCMNDCKDPASINITSEPPPADNTELPAVEPETVAASPGRSTYEQACALCHAAGIGEAPIPGDASTWGERIEQGRETLISNALAGIGIMPPKGGQIQLGDDEVIAAVDYMIEQPLD